MPQSVGSLGWVRSVQIPVFSVKSLAKEEIDSFLEFLFHDVAYPPKPLRLREVAGVVRYLDALATAGVPRSIVQQGETCVHKYCDEAERDDQGGLRTRNWAAKQAVNTIAKGLWSALRQCGKFNPATKGEVIEFLKAHGTSYLPQTVDAALAFVRDAEPYDGAQMFRSPALISRSHVVNAGGRRIPNDLSERIAIAKIALKDVKIRSVDSRIARALEKNRCPRRNKSTDWQWIDVQERAKEFISLHHKMHKLRKKAEEALQSLVDSWIIRFRQSKTLIVRSSN